MRVTIIELPLLHKTKTSPQGNRQCTEHYLQYAHMISHLTVMVENCNSDSGVSVAPTSIRSEMTTAIDNP